MTKLEMVIKGLESLKQDYLLCKCDTNSNVIDEAIAMLKEQETSNIYKCPNCGTWVSAENVVRCKDCRHWDYRTEGCMHLTGRIAPMVKTGADWYCHDGERKDT